MSWILTAFVMCFAPLPQACMAGSPSPQSEVVYYPDQMACMISSEAVVRAGMSEHPLIEDMRIMVWCEAVDEST